MADDVIISSFNHDYLRQIRQKDENLAIAVLNDPPINAPVTYLRKMKANAYNLNCYHDFQNDHFNSLSGRRYLAHLAKANKAGFGVNIWTCNDPEEIGYLIDAGVSGIISDYPNRVNSQLNKKTKISS
jgi:glycerophosphoryl diester phosphodiesterase